MKKSGRYTTTGLAEDQYEEGSHGLVLKNSLHLRDKQVIEEVETRELYRVTDRLTEIYDQNHRFTTADICSMHKKWLGTVYEWAGKYRQVTMSKGGFTFALPRVIPQLMADFEKNELNRFTPCNFKNQTEQAQALAIVHTELLLIHPFREGNGRLSRLLATLMALQAGLPPLDFSEFEGGRKEEYFTAVRQGMARDYRPMEKFFNAVIARTLQAYEEK
ncbi:MAG: Fic family protein [Desulfobulbaceae bacterium]|nr:Fic family protein [Desulfobulbaceae bacterium]HIJ91595.1 cell filamentation protein Fic [Deltaproteobacteria bacterium]